jgi:hypothetical protein
VNEDRATRGASGEGVLNRQARLFLIAWTIFLFCASLATLAVVADWLGIGEVARERAAVGHGRWPV